MFGEMALFFEQRRTANVIAVGFCELYVLSRADFKEVMKLFPAEEKIMKEVAEKRREELKIKEDSCVDRVLDVSVLFVTHFRHNTQQLRQCLAPKRALRLTAVSSLPFLFFPFRGMILNLDWLPPTVASTLSTGSR